MRTLSRFAGGVTLVAMLGAVAAPATARPGRWGPPPPRHHHHDRGGDGFGVFLGVAALVGAAAIVATSAAKDRRAGEEESTLPPPPPHRNGHYHAGSDTSPIDHGNGVPGRDATVSASSDNRGEDAAVDDCARAARDEGSQDGGYAEVRDITGTRPWNGGFAVDGTVDQRAGYRRAGVIRRFSCTWRDGRVEDMILSRDSVAAR